MLFKFFILMMLIGCYGKVNHPYDKHDTNEYLIKKQKELNSSKEETKKQHEKLEKTEKKLEESQKKLEETKNKAKEKINNKLSQSLLETYQAAENIKDNNINMIYSSIDAIDKINNNKNKIYDYFKKNRTSNSKILDEYFMNNQKPDKNTLEMLDSKEISKITNDLSECLKYIINDTN